jgi:hypothetical protein
MNDLNELIQNKYPDGFTKRDEANSIVAYAFRNTMLEDLHAGEDSELVQDDKYSRITQDEMKELMIETSIKMEQLLLKRESNYDEYMLMVKSYGMMFCLDWER